MRKRTIGAKSRPEALVNCLTKARARYETARHRALTWINLTMKNAGAGPRTCERSTAPDQRDSGFHPSAPMTPPLRA